MQIPFLIQRRGNRCARQWPWTTGRIALQIRPTLAQRHDADDKAHSAFEVRLSDDGDGGEKPVEAMKTVFGRSFDLLEHVPDGDDDGRDVFRIVIFSKR